MITIEQWSQILKSRKDYRVRTENGVYEIPIQGLVPGAISWKIYIRDLDSTCITLISATKVTEIMIKEKYPEYWL